MCITSEGQKQFSLISGIPQAEPTHLPPPHPEVLSGLLRSMADRKELLKPHLLDSGTVAEQ